MHVYHWSPALDARLRKLVAKGRKRTSIAKKLRRTVDAVQKRMLRLGLA